MDVVPRSAGKALVIATGLLAFLGVGCVGPQSQDEAWKLSGIAFDKLVFSDAGDRSHVQGVERVCSLENARVLFAKDLDWSSLHNELKNQEGQGWKLTSFCFDKKRMSSVFILEKSWMDERDIERRQFRIGVDGGTVGFNSPRFTDPMNMEEGGWLGPWTLDIQQNVATAGIEQEDLSATKRHTYTFPFNERSEEGQALRKESCTISRNDIPPGMKVTFPPNCKE